MCGSSFTATQQVIIMGMSKKHKDCFQAGKPLHTADFTPKQVEHGAHGGNVMALC